MAKLVQGKVNVEMKKTSTILKEKGLDEGGTVQQYFTRQLAKEMNNYIPYDKGRLKDDSVIIGNDYVKYDIEYARKQYFTNVKGGTKNRSGLRGKLWDKRCWNDKGDIILKRVSKFLKGGEG